MALFNTPALDDREVAVVAKIEQLKGQLGYLVDSTSARWQGLLRRNTFARAIQGSNSIEGYHVSVEDAVAAVEGAAPMDATTESWRAVLGYRSAMTYVMQMAKDPHARLTAETLRSLHFMMMEYDMDKKPGQWRPGVVYVRREPTGEIVYEGPPADQVPDLIDELVESLQLTDVHPRISAALAHLNFVMIHPFKDGNGRMARCLQTLVLAKATGTLHPVFSSIEEYLGRNTPEYYAVLGAVGAGAWHPERDPHPWVRFCLTAHFRQATTLLRRSREYEQLWNMMEALLKQAGLPERIGLALHDAAMGLRVRNPTYRTAAEVSDQVASKDLKAAVAMNFLIPKGEKRGRYYEASPMLLGQRKLFHEPGAVPDPFDDPPTAPQEERNRSR